MFVSWAHHCLADFCSHLITNLVPFLDLLPLSEQRFDKMMRDKQLMDKQRQDRLISSLSQTLTTAVNTKLEKLVKNEIKNSVIPSIV